MAALLRADDDRPHLRGGEEGELRNRIVATGRAIFVLYMGYFARTPRAVRRPALLAIAPLAIVHAGQIARLYGLFRRERRSQPPAPPVGGLHGALGYTSLAALLLAEVRGPNRVSRIAEWYPYVGMGVVDLLDGAVRRGRRPLAPYAALAALTMAAGAARRRSPTGA
jgi:hypothetical protein